MVGDGDFTVNYTARWQRAHQGGGSDLPLVPVPTLRDTLVASAREQSEVETEGPVVPRHDPHEGDW
jgi:acyl CoA:acetate/3-ketoacid CoA transferase alpha subunit